MDIRYIGVARDVINQTPSFEVRADACLHLWRDVLCLFQLFKDSLLSDGACFDPANFTHAKLIQVARLAGELEREKKHGRAGTFSLEDILVAAESILLHEKANSIYSLIKLGVPEALIQRHKYAVIDALCIKASAAVASVRDVREIFLLETGRADDHAELADMSFRLGMEFLDWDATEHLQDIVDEHMKSAKEIA